MVGGKGGAGFIRLGECPSVTLWILLALLFFKNPKSTKFKSKKCISVSSLVGSAYLLPLLR